MESIEKDRTVAFQLRGKRDAVRRELNKNLDELLYNDASSNYVLGRIRELVIESLDQCSPNLAVEVIIQIPGIASGIKGADDEDCTYRHIEVIVRPLWGYCE